jgi:dTDP-4-dehydrorhamnose 3,5-epimerase
MEIKETALVGCFELQPLVRKDARGRFVKTFQQPIFREMDLVTDFAEEYYSVSAQNVIRGLHFQVPPADGEKVVYCVDGSIFDVVLDLRRNSQTYGKYFSCRLDCEIGNMLYIPRGMAHGFCVLSKQAVMMYKVASVYAPLQDKGVRWDSVGISWPAENPILSERDQKFPSFQDFVSPF